LEVARAISRIIFENPGGFMEICGLRVNIEQVHCFFVKWQEFSGFGIIFQWEKVVDSVHGFVDHARWLVHSSTMDSTVADGRGSPELGLAAASGHDGLP
jgi:hypothetical protein